MKFEHNTTVLDLELKSGDKLTFGADEGTSVIGSEVRDGIFIVGVADDSDGELRILSHGYPLSEVAHWVIDEEPRPIQEGAQS